MGAIWAIAELVGGQPTRLSLELASLAASLGSAAGVDASVVVVGGDDAATAMLAAHGPGVLAVDVAEVDAPAAASVATVVAALMERQQPDLVLVGATPDGKDVAGALVGLTDLPVLVAASGLSSDAGVPIAQMSIFGGRLVTDCVFEEGRGIVIVRPGAISAQMAPQPGPIEHVTAVTEARLPAVTVVDSVVEAAAGPSIDDARIIIGAGRGIGGADGLSVINDLAQAVGGAVGATRAVVDSGWIDFAQQIGQTGKTVKPDLYIACGVSGAIQHKVGVQSAGTIVAINKDPDAPIAEFADLLVVGDLFEIVPALAAALREHRSDD